MTDRNPSWDELEDYLRAKGWTTTKVGVFYAPEKSYRLRMDLGQSIDIAIVGIASAEGRGPGDVRRDIIDGIAPEPEPEKTFTLAKLEEYAYERYVEWKRSVRTSITRPGRLDVGLPLQLGAELNGVVRMLAVLRKSVNSDDAMEGMRETMRADMIHTNLSHRFREEQPDFWREAFD